MPTREERTRKILTPYHGLEAITVQQAENITGWTESTLKRRIADQGLGRKINGGRRWHISRVALAMYLDGNVTALAAYHAGVRKTEPVASYYRRLGLDDLLRTSLFDL